MTDLRTVAQQALEAMLNCPDDISDDMFDSIIALKAALAGPIPHGCHVYSDADPDPCVYHGWVLRDVLFDNGDPVGHREPVQEPQRKPLTEEEIKACEKQAMVNGALPFEQRMFFARAIERAHGIGD